jgi:hypothetical protein
MISASKTTYSHYNLKILRQKVKKNIKNFRKKFCEFLPWYLKAKKVSVTLFPPPRKSRIFFNDP